MKKTYHFAEFLLIGDNHEIIEEILNKKIKVSEVTNDSNFLRLLSSIKDERALIIGEFFKKFHAVSESKVQLIQEIKQLKLKD